MMVGRGCIVAVLLAVSCPAGSAQTEPVGTRQEQVPVEPKQVIGLRFETGAWRTKTQLVFEPHTKALTRKTYTVWDPFPSRGLDFTWIPDPPAANGPERPTGRGRLVWRLAGVPAYDDMGFAADYVGEMKDGRAEGYGVYTERNGLSYEGRWRAGRPAGRGTLKLGDGAEYTGTFRAGVAHGTGRYFDVDGEIYEGTFRGGLRDGRGRTILPNGAAYRAEWANGEEVPHSRKLRLAQLGPLQGTLPGDDVRLGIVLDRVPDQGVLQYSATNTDAGLLIEPASKRLLGLWKGNDEIQLLPNEEEPRSETGSYGVFAFAEADIRPLTLVLNVQNRGGSPVQVTGAYLDVDASVTDRQPAIQLSVGSSGMCGARPREDYSPYFELQNFGWAPAEKAQLRFAFASPKSTAKPSGFTLSKDVGTIAASVKVDMEAELRAAGVKVDALKQRSGKTGFKCRSTQHDACLAEIAASGLFGSLARLITLEDRDIGVDAAGNLEYVWRDQNGLEKTRVSPFKARLLLARTPSQAECGEGGEKELITKRPLELRLDQAHYRLPVAFERTIPPGRTARYLLAVRAAKSSQHSFRVVIQFADGRQLVSRPISLNYFLPNTANRPG